MTLLSDGTAAAKAGYGDAVKFVGLSGGIGCGKSTVAAGLTARGADVIDVDVVSRAMQEPGQALFERIVERWGSGVVAADGRLDRDALSRIVFADRDQLQELTMMAAPLTEAEIVRRARAHVGTDGVAVVEAAMFQKRMYGMEGLVVVDVPVDTVVGRLVRFRGMREDDARARIASQIPRLERLEHADFVINNSGAPEAVGAQLEQLWEWILGLPDANPG